jgi:hypothetical protein
MKQRTYLLLRGPDEGRVITVNGGRYVNLTAPGLHGGWGLMQYDLHNDRDALDVTIAVSGGHVEV